MYGMAAKAWHLAAYMYIMKISFHQAHLLYIFCISFYLLYLFVYENIFLSFSWHVKSYGRMYGAAGMYVCSNDGNPDEAGTAGKTALEEGNCLGRWFYSRACRPATSRCW